MPFGVTNASQIFQHLMDSVLWDLPFLFVYLDDILVASASKSEHMVHLFFEWLKEHGLIINLAKCRFSQITIDFLRHRVIKDGVTPFPSRLAAITSFPQPLTTKSLQEFLGIVNFYHQVNPHAAQFMQPVNEALKGIALKYPMDCLGSHEKPFLLTLRLPKLPP